jgi:hypothetical protein
MIRVGKYGSINVFWNNKLMSSIPKHKQNRFDELMIEANVLLLEKFREGMTLKFLIDSCYFVINNFYKKKLKNKKTSANQHELFNSSILVLLRLKKLDYDDVILEMPEEKSFCKSSICLPVILASTKNLSAKNLSFLQVLSL